MKNIYKKFMERIQGFGLIEVIIGLSMLMITATAALSLAKTVVRTEAHNVNRVVAYNLGQQVMEEVRRARDSAWDDFKSDTRWIEEGASESILLNDLKTYGSACVYDGYNAADNAETVTCEIDNKEFTITKTVENVVNVATLHGTDALSPYEQRGGADGGDMMSPELAKRVMIKVEWVDRGATRDLVLVTIFTDWRPGFISKK